MRPMTQLELEEAAKLEEACISNIETTNWSDTPLTEQEKHLIGMAVTWTFHRLTVKDVPDLVDLDLSPRVMNALDRQKIETVEELILHTEVDLKSLPNVGQGSVDKIKAALDKHGLMLRLQKKRPAEAA